MNQTKRKNPSMPLTARTGGLLRKVPLKPLPLATAWTMETHPTIWRRTSKRKPAPLTMRKTGTMRSAGQSSFFLAPTATMATANDPTTRAHRKRHTTAPALPFSSSSSQQMFWKLSCLAKVFSSRNYVPCPNPCLLRSRTLQMRTRSCFSSCVPPSSEPWEKETMCSMIVISILEKRRRYIDLMTSFAVASLPSSSRSSWTPLSSSSLRRALLVSCRIGIFLAGCGRKTETRLYCRSTSWGAVR